MKSARPALDKTPFRRAYDLTVARPLFIDAWPDAWRGQAPPTTLVWLDAREMRWLGSQIMGCRHWFEPVEPVRSGDLPARLEAAICQQGPACFVRLSSRSPKDSLRAMRHGLCVHNAAEALSLMFEGSQRVAHDLRACLDAGIPLAVAVRPWLAFAPWQEWRCVMRQRRWAGASARLALGDADAAQARAMLAPCREWLPLAVATLAQHAHVDDAVFDLVIQPPTGSDTWRWTLLDANPLTAQTGLGRFASLLDLDETVRCG